MLFHKNHTATLHSETMPWHAPFTARRRYLIAKIRIIFEIIHNQAHFYTLLNKTGTNRSIYFVDVYSEIFIYSSIQLGQEGF